MALGEIRSLGVRVGREIEAVRLLRTEVVGIGDDVWVRRGPSGNEQVAIGEERVTGTEHVVRRGELRPYQNRGSSGSAAGSRRAVIDWHACRTRRQGPIS